jgi:hypothetical protein
MKTRLNGTVSTSATYALIVKKIREYQEDLWSSFFGVVSASFLSVFGHFWA